MARAANRITPWDPRRLPPVDPKIVEWSKGFLRCQPLSWFPDLDRDWRTFCLGLGWEASVDRLEPSLILPKYAQERFFASCQGEPLAVVMEKHGAAQLGEMFLQSALAPIRSVGLGYLARRLLARMSKSWVGGEQLRLIVDTELTALDSFFAASINFVVRINARSIEGAFLLGPRMVGLLDGLWRRQLRASTQTELTFAPLHLIASELKVLPLELPTMLAQGNVIDLEKAAHEDFSLVRGGGSGSRVRVSLCSGQHGTFVVRTAAPSEPAPLLGGQFSRISFSLGEMTLDPMALAELHQVGSYLETSVPLTSEVTILVAGEPAGRAVLGISGNDKRLVATVL